MWKITALIRPPLAQSRLACGLGTGIFISCGNEPYIHTDMRTELNTARKAFSYTCTMQTETCSVFAYAYACIFCMCPWTCTCHLNISASTHKHKVKHNFEVDKNTTLLLWSSHSLPNIPWTMGVYGPTWGWQRSVVTSRSLTGSVLNHNHTITTRRTGARWACHYPGHNTNITPVLSLYIHARGASSGAWAVKVYFWMYSLHSERVAVGARQLWRQCVIVARQPDRPKMAELTGTGEQASLHLHSLAFGKFSLLTVPTNTP